MKKLGLGFAILTAFVLLPLGGFCQSNPPANGGEENNAPATTTVAGIVRTVQDVPVPGAAVRVVHLASGRSWASWTDEDGKFSFPSLPAGRYRLEAKQLGFGASQLEVYFAEGATTEAQLMLHVDASSTAAADAKPETEAQPAAVNASTAPENVKSPGPAEESTSTVTKNGNQHQTAAENPASGPTAGKPSAKASSSQKSHHKGFQQLETKGQPTPAEANTTSPSENAQSGSNNSKGTAQQQSLSAASAAPDDASAPLGDASSSDAFLMSGTVNRSAALGGPGSFGAGGASTGAGNFDTSAAAASGEFPLPGQGGDSTGTGKVSSKGHKSQAGQRRKAKQAQAPTEANSFGQGIEELWAQHRLSRLS
jgi:hypothetical protein